MKVGVLRIKHRPLVTIEVSYGWVMCAIQAGGMAAPDAVELSMQGARAIPDHGRTCCCGCSGSSVGTSGNPHS